MTLMNIRLELGRTGDHPQGDPRHGYEFVAPLDQGGHLDAGAWSDNRDRCAVRNFRPDGSQRQGLLKHLGRGWRFDYVPGIADDQPFFRLDKHVIAPGQYVTITEEDGVERPFKVVAVAPAGVTS